MSLSLCVSQISKGKAVLDDKKPSVCSYMENEDMDDLTVSLRKCIYF